MRQDKSKEELSIERRKIAETIAQLAIDGTRIAFFSDNDSLTTLKRVGEPLMLILQEKGFNIPITIIFYVSGMVSKLKMTVKPNESPEITFDPTYGKKYRLDAQCVAQITNVIGELYENENGKMTGSGILKDYYFEKLTVPGSNGTIRNTLFSPDFKTALTKHGNIQPPVVQLRDRNPQTKDVSMISISGLPTDYRAEMIKAIAKRFYEELTIE